MSELAEDELMVLLPVQLTEAGGEPLNKFEEKIIEAFRLAGYTFLDWGEFSPASHPGHVEATFYKTATPSTEER